MPSAWSLIYAGVIPLIKVYITMVAGYLFSRSGLLPPSATRAASSIAMNFSLPALVFASIVPAFTSENISALGPLSLLAFIYVMIGLVFGLVIREVCYVPRNFWQGIVVATAMSNWGNLPTAVVISVTKQSPFDPSKDTDLGVSFISIFILIYHISFWVCGFARSLAWDYAPGVPQGEAAERRLHWREKPIGSFVYKHIMWSSPIHKITEKASQRKEFSVPPAEDKNPGIQENTQVAEEGRVASPPLPESQSVQHVSDGIHEYTRQRPGINDSGGAPDSSAWRRPLRIIATMFTPINSVIAVSLVVALVEPLKALFVDISGVGGPSWAGPDGNPPLSFIIDTASFVGALTVPLTLILLGSSFARMRVPRPLSRLPILAILLVCVAKMVLLPTFGIFLVRAMVGRQLIPKESKTELFVAMFLSGTPTAINQLVVSGLYSTNGDLDTLSVFLLAQYTFMFFASSALTSVSLLLATTM